MFRVMFMKNWRSGVLKVDKRLLNRFCTPLIYFLLTCFASNKT